MGDSRFLEDMVRSCEGRGEDRDEPGAVHGHPRSGAVGIELDVERSHVGIESDAWSDAVALAEGVVDGGILVTDGKLRTDCAFKIWDFSDIPSSKAGWVAVVSTLFSALGSVEVAMEVHLFTGVILVDGLTTSFDVVDAVLDRVDTP